VIYFYEEYVYISSVLTILAFFIGGFSFLWISKNLIYKLIFFLYSIFSLWDSLSRSGLSLSYLAESVFLPLESSLWYWEEYSIGLGGVAACTGYIITYLIYDIYQCIKYVKDNVL